MFIEMIKKHHLPNEHEKTESGNRNSVSSTQDRVVRITPNKAILIVASSILGSAGVSIWGTLAVANTIPFRVSAIETKVDKFEKTYMPLDLSTERWNHNEKEINEIQAAITEVRKEVSSIKDILLSKR